MEKIKVAIRTRPHIEREEQEEGRNNWRIQNNTIFQLNGVGKPLPNTSYSFDYIFDQTAPTTLLYDELIAPIVHSVVAGFNGTVFAYGQTSSGKTFTMMGAHELPGIIQFTFSGIFKHIDQSNNCEFVLRLSYMEIYNETIMDLLNPSNSNLSIRESDDRIPYVANLTEEHITDYQTLDMCLYNGEKNRHTGRTNMNDRSSRSHTLLRLILESKQFDEGAIKVSHLNLVDLAGSERASATTGDGLRFKEGTFINRSLLTLGTVIRRLSEAKKDTHIPYRDSKLTRILESSLGGNAKTVIICTVTTASVEETHSTLRFASRAKSVENHAIVNEYPDDSDVDTMLKRLKKLEKENLSLKKRIFEDTSCRSQLQDMESKIFSLKSMVIRSNNLNVEADQVPIARRYTMGALPSNRPSGVTSKLLNREQPVLSPNLDLARRMMNRSDHRRRRGGNFEPIKIQFDHIIEEKESPVLKECSSIESSSDEHFISLYVSSESSNTTLLTPKGSHHSLAQTMCSDYVPMGGQLMSSSTQTDVEALGDFPATENVAMGESAGEMASVFIQTEAVIEFTSTTIEQDPPLDTTYEYNPQDNIANASILIQTEYVEETVTLENSSVSTQTEKNEIYDSFLKNQSVQADMHIDTSPAHSTCTTFQPTFAPSPFITHNSPNTAGTDTSLHDISISVQTDDTYTSLLTHHVMTVDTASSPLIISTHSTPTQHPETDCYPTTTNTSMQTDYIYKMTQEVSVQAEQEPSALPPPPSPPPLCSVECWVQTDADDVTPGVAVSRCTASVQTDVVEAVKRQSISTQKSSDGSQDNRFITANRLSPNSSYENISAMQSQTEMEIADILNEPSSLPVETSHSSISERFDNFIVQTTNGSVQTEDIEYCSIATATEFEKNILNNNSTQTEFLSTTDKETGTETEATNINLDILDRFGTENGTHNESIIFGLSEKVCEVEAINEELILDLEFSSISNHALLQTQNHLKGILTNMINKDTIETSRQLIDSMESSEISSLLETLLEKINNHRVGEQLEVVTSPNEAIEEIKLMVSNWSDADIQQLPQYLLTVKAEIQRLNDLVENKDSFISGLRTQLNTVSLQQTQSVVSEEILVELQHLKNNNQLLEAQLNQSEVKIKEYASLLSELQEDPCLAPNTVDTCTMTDGTVVFSAGTSKLIDDQLREINNIHLSQVAESRRRIGVNLQTLKPFEKPLGLSNILPFLDRLSESLKLYINDLDALSETKKQMEQHKGMYILTKEENSRLRSGMELSQTSKQKAQLSLNSAMDEITDLFKVNDQLEQQIKQTEEEAEKRRIVWERKQKVIEQEANNIIEEKELLISQANSVTKELRNELASVHNHYSDYLGRDQVQVTTNRVVELERDTASLQTDNQNLMATRSHLESNILHLKTQLEMDRLERGTLTQDYTRQLQQQEEELSLLRENQLCVKDSEIGGLKENVKNLEISLQDRREEAQSNKLNSEKNKEEFNELLEAYRDLRKQHFYNTDELLPEMSYDLNNLEKENKVLKESLSNLTDELTKLKHPGERDTDCQTPDDKLSLLQLQSKCNFQQRRMAFLEDQCRNIERRRQLEVSAMPKHDFMSLRADRASFKAQARGSSKAPLIQRDYHSTGDVPFDNMNSQPDTQTQPKCNNQ